MVFVPILFIPFKNNVFIYPSPYRYASFTIFAWRNAIIALEALVEIGNILKTHPVANIRNVVIARQQKFGSLLHTLAHDILIRGLARQLLDLTVEFGASHMHHLRQTVNGEIRIRQMLSNERLEVLQYILIHNTLYYLGSRAFSDLLLTAEFTELSPASVFTKSIVFGRFCDQVISWIILATRRLKLHGFTI